jgi:hypothetical protein
MSQDPISDPAPDALPAELPADVRTLLSALHRAWLRSPDQRLGQLLNNVDCLDVEDHQLHAALEHALTTTTTHSPHVTPPPRTLGPSSRVFSGVRDPGRIPAILGVLAKTRLGHPELSICQIINQAAGTDRGGQHSLALLEDTELHRRLVRLNIERG